MKEIEIQNIAEYNELLKESKHILIIDAYADWCSPCKKLKPILIDVIKNHKNVQLVKINTDEVEEIIDALGVKSLPSIYAIINGKVVSSFVGLQNEKFVSDFIDKINV